MYVCVRFLVVSSSLRSHGLLPARLLCPWNYPGKNTGVGCHSLLQGIFLIQVAYYGASQVGRGKDDASSKEPSCQCRRLTDVGSIPELGRFPREVHGNPLYNCCLENPHGQRSLGRIQSPGFQRVRRD